MNLENVHNEPSNSRSELSSEEEKEINKSVEKSMNSSDFQEFSEANLKGPYNNGSQMLSFFNSYARFINDASHIILDLDVVLIKLVEAIKKLKPPENSSPHITDIWTSLLEINKKSIEETSESLSKMPENKLYETVQDLEKLNIKLMIEYNLEVKRGKSLKIINNDNE